MIESEGVVERLEGDYAWVRSAGAGFACGACVRKDGCATAGGAGLADRDGRQRLLKIRNDIQARPGDAVRILAADGLVFRAVWNAYGVPLVLGIGGALVAGTWLGEGAAVAGLVAGLAAGFFRMRQRSLEAHGREPILSIGFKEHSVNFPKRS